MKTYLTRIPLLVILPLLVGGTIAQAQSDIESWGKACAVVLQPDELTIKYGTDSALAFRETICGSSSTEDSSEGGLNVIEILTLDGGTQTKTRSEFCKDTSLVAKSTTIWSYWYKKTTDLARIKFTECMASFPQQQAGAPPALLMTFSNSANDAIAITARWDKNISGEQPKFASVTSSGILCAATAFPWAAGALIPENPSTALCKWSDSYSTSGFVVVNTQNRGSSVIRAIRTITPLGTARLMITRREDLIDGFIEVRGPKVGTGDAHNVRCSIIPDPKPYPLTCMGDWIAAFYDFPVSLPDNVPLIDHAAIRASLRLDCEDGGNGSAAWNLCGATDRIKVVAEDAKQITVRRAFGSKPLQAQLVAAVPKHVTVNTTSEVGTFTLPKESGGYRLPIRVAKGATATLDVTWADGTRESIPVGTESSRLKLVQSTATTPNPIETATHNIFMYRVAWQAEGLIEHKIYK